MSIHPLFINKPELMNEFKIFNYKKDEIIANEDEKCTYVGLVLSGSISIYTYDYSKNEYEIANISENGIFGEFLIFSNNNEFLGNIVAKKETRIIKIPYYKLLALLKDETVLTNYMKMVSSISMRQQQKVKILSQKTIRDKIMFYLLSICKHTNTCTVKIKSKEKLASLLNVTRPSLSRELIYMKNDGLITFDYHSITIL